MSEFERFEAWRSANETALAIHRKWEDLDPDELGAMVLKLRRELDPFFDWFPAGWYRKEQLLAHVGAMASNLSSANKESCHRDINDLVYADMPALFTHLLTEYKKSLSR
ncbi:hypothetical protein [Pseudomonas rubra]|uniref:Uncharacterized protein n=1 Tax=Pseudomonas rubra TaxID=2942627 RepID=A0ABT5PEX5_9PSED|nr:hypothetical protein [Pseudomonas rubra]MDD1016856.1 hypothetical protein [Pseudomonas rubra]MDD1039398.1 hypothetical protein [Pseudomonas rubra]MDD1157820.1 hypothetical protein [Pseudomonas rubra]